MGHGLYQANRLPHDVEAKIPQGTKPRLSSWGGSLCLNLLGGIGTGSRFRSGSYSTIDTFKSISQKAASGWQSFGPPHLHMYRSLSGLPNQSPRIEAPPTFWEVAIQWTGEGWGSSAPTSFMGWSYEWEMLTIILFSLIITICGWQIWTIKK